MAIIQQPRIPLPVRTAIAVTAALALTGCASTDEILFDDAPDDPQEVVTIGVAMSSPGLISGTNPGNLSGVEVDLATTVIDRMESVPADAELAWVATTADTVVEGLDNGELDIAIGQFNETDLAPPAARVGPYATVQAGLLVHQPPADQDPELLEVLQPAQVEALTDLADASVCVVAGSSAENAELYGAVIESTVSECEVGMRSGRYDAIAADDLQLAGLLMDPAFTARYEFLSWSELITEADDEGGDAEIDETLLESDQYWIGVNQAYCAEAGETFETVVTDGVVEDLFGAWDDVDGFQVQPVEAEDVTLQHCDAEV